MFLWFPGILQFGYSEPTLVPLLTSLLSPSPCGSGPGESYSGGPGTGGGGRRGGAQLSCSTVPPCCHPALVPGPKGTERYNLGAGMGVGWRGACEGRDFREGFQEVWLGKGWFIYGWSLRKSAWVWRTLLLNILGFPGGSVGKEFACNAGDSLQLRRPGFNPWVGKIWRRKWQPTPLFLPGKSHGQSLAG